MGVHSCVHSPSTTRASVVAASQKRSSISPFRMTSGSTRYVQSQPNTAAWPKFVNIYHLLLHYLYICIKSLLHYLFLILYFCTLLSSIYLSVLSVTPIFASCSVISIYLIYDLNFHFKQYIPCFARTGVEGNLGLYFADDSEDVILTMQHGFTMAVSVKLDKYGHSYFNADLWRKCLSVMN